MMVFGMAGNQPALTASAILPHPVWMGSLQRFTRDNSLVVYEETGRYYTEKGLKGTSKNRSIRG
jgi:hypothetical protein